MGTWVQIEAGLHEWGRSKRVRLHVMTRTSKALLRWEVDNRSHNVIIAHFTLRWRAKAVL